MSRRGLAMAAVVLLMGAMPLAFAEEKKADPLPGLLEKLRRPVDLGKIVGDVGLRDYAALVAEKIGVPILIDPDPTHNGVALADSNEVRVRPVTGKLAAGKALAATLASAGQVFLIRKDYLLITSLETAARETKGKFSDEGRLTEPLVSAAIREKPLNEALADLAEDYDVTVVLAPQVGDAKTAFVSARLLNVPLDKALELLALQADLRVLPRGNAFLITTIDQSNNLFSEKLDRRKQELEAARVPTTPPAVPPAGENK